MCIPRSKTINSGLLSGTNILSIFLINLNVINNKLF